MYDTSKPSFVLREKREREKKKTHVINSLTNIFSQAKITGALNKKNTHGNYV